MMCGAESCEAAVVGSNEQKQAKYAKDNILSSLLPALTDDKSLNYIIQATFIWPSSEHACSRHAIRLTHWLCSSCELWIFQVKSVPGESPGQARLPTNQACSKTCVFVSLGISYLM